MVATKWHYILKFHLYVLVSFIFYAILLLCFKYYYIFMLMFKKLRQKQVFFLLNFYISFKVQALLGRSDKNISEKLINKRMAYSLAEQAFAHAYDVGLVYLDEKKQKLETAIKIYDRAFSIGSRYYD